MKGSLLVLVLLVAAACSTGGGGPAPPSPSAARLVYWPPGRYDLEAYIQYGRATTFEAGIVTVEYFAQLLVTPNGSMILSSSSGSCHDPLPAEVGRDESLGRRSFVCGEVTYYLTAEGGRIRGEIMVSVQEDTRERGRCIRSITGANGRERCVESSWHIESRRVDKRARLRVSTSS